MPTNQNVEEDHVISMEMKEIHIHASGRFIVNNDKGNFVALRLIIKKKTFIHAFNIYAFICNIVNESPIRLFSTSNWMDRSQNIVVLVVSKVYF
jgi:hypothetical protein